MKGERHRQARKKGENKKSRYNREYERCVTKEISKYLGRERGERKLMARFRCGNEERREQVLGGKRGEKVQDVLRGERDDRAHVERMRRNERGRERNGKKY
jgi:hypothetical protein